jgi:hypothetical protein
MSNRTFVAGLVAGTFLAVPAVLFAANVGSLISFSNGTVADADEVNANFDALRNAVNDNDGRIGTLESADGAFIAPDAPGDCPSTVAEGTIRYAAGRFEGCAAEGWVPLDSVGLPGSSPGQPADSCQAVLDANPSAATGTYFLRGLSGTAFEAYCDMDTDGGGWTLLGTISGSGSNVWAAEFGPWSDTSLIGSVDAPWADYKSRAWFDLDVTQAEAMYQRRFNRSTRAKVKLSNACLFGVATFDGLFTTNDYTLNCAVSEITVLQQPSDSSGLSSGDYREGIGQYGLGISTTNGFCWNGGDDESNTLRGHAGWNQQNYDCVDAGHLGYVGVWTGAVGTGDIPGGVNWTPAGSTNLVDVSLFVR